MKFATKLPSSNTKELLPLSLTTPTSPEHRPKINQGAGATFYMIDAKDYL
jgi:hypothetical protein